MADIEKGRANLVARILEGHGKASSAQRVAAFRAADMPGPLGDLISKVVRAAHRITDTDVDDVRDSGMTEDQIFELVVCAAVGEATRQHESARAALAAALGEKPV